MKKFFIGLLLIITLTFFSCQKMDKESKGGPKRSILVVEDIELKKWREEINKEVYNIEVTKLENPFITPKTYKFLTKKETEIPLELVGILDKRNKKYALLQDPTKKGYIVKVGDKIGRAKIKEISLDYIVIEEEEEDLFGGITKKN